MSLLFNKLTPPAPRSSIFSSSSTPPDPTTRGQNKNNGRTLSSVEQIKNVLINEIEESLIGNKNNNLKAKGNQVTSPHLTQPNLTRLNH